jgi:hypothetical protein
MFNRKPHCRNFRIVLHQLIPLFKKLGFCDLTKLKFGIVQKKGGPCGVLASIQAYVLYELIFSNGESPKDLNLV